MGKKMRSDLISRRRLDLRWAIVLVTALCFVAGCGETVPDIVPLTVSVKTAKGKPLNRVDVRFVPMLESLDGNFIAKRGYGC